MKMYERRQIIVWKEIEKRNVGSREYEGNSGTLQEVETCEMEEEGRDEDDVDVDVEVRGDDGNGEGEEYRKIRAEMRLKGIIAQRERVTTRRKRRERIDSTKFRLTDSVQMKSVGQLCSAISCEAEIFMEACRTGKVMMGFMEQSLV